MSAELFQRYQELQRYVGWTADDAERVRSAGALVAAELPAVVDDFYEEIERHPAARKVIVGGQEQILRLKGTLIRWLEDLFSGNYDEAYVTRRWRVGYRHVEIGLDQVYTNAALSRIRRSLMHVLERNWRADAQQLLRVRESINTLLDLDLAMIEDAYQHEYGARLQRQERLAAIGQVAGGVAHELRNPLNVIKTSVYYLLNARAPTSEKTSAHLKRIERHVALSDGVITALSNFARLPTPQQVRCPAQALVREALEMCTPPPGVEINIDCAEDLPPMFVDGDQIRIVIANLIRNACDAMPAGGRLDIQARGADDSIELAVRDTGAGIAAENLAHIMEPLYSTKARGLGLGLAIARAILDKNKGSLHVTSVPDTGSTFVIKLPAAPGVATA